MCGLVALFRYHAQSPELDRGELEKMRDYMSGRGPDGSGAWFSADRRVALGHRRLSIVDLSDAGAQPMTNETGSLRLVFNGEIYNYQPLREHLIEQGHTFSSHADTEVLLHLYEEKGERMFDDLRGMFAFALWDAERNGLLLARDHYGIKPLYYADDGRVVRVASQVKALLSGGRVSREQEPAGICGFYITGSVPEPFTTYKEIRSVPAGSYLWITERGAKEPRSYFSVAAIFRDARLAASDSSSVQRERVVADALLDSVRHHLIADVPVIAFLSAGIDSGSIVGLARDAGAENLQTVTLAFEEYQGKAENEAPLAAQIACHYGTRHSTRVLGEAEFCADLPKILEAMDQPTIDGINTYFVSKASAELGVKAALSGLGGDELFGGYPSFQDIPRWVERVAAVGRVPGLGKVARSFVAPFISENRSPKLAGMIEYGGTYAGAYLLRRGLFMPWELKNLLGEEMASEGLRRLKPLEYFNAMLQPDPGLPFARVAALEASLYMRNQLLRDADWAGMAHSLEIRTPLVDAQLLKSLAPVLIKESARGKSLLAKSPSRPLPRSITARPKTGFTVPISRWIEQNKSLDVWRKIPELSRPGIHWSRRWAYTAVELGVSL